MLDVVLFNSSKDENSEKDVVLVVFIALRDLITRLIETNMVLVGEDSTKVLASHLVEVLAVQPLVLMVVFIVACIVVFIVASVVAVLVTVVSVEQVFVALA